MNIVAISDTHDQHEKIIIPPADVLIVAGDFTCHRIPQVQNYINFNNWLGKQPCSYKIVVAGNHDTLFENNLYFAGNILSNAIYLHNSFTHIRKDFQRFKVYGSPFTPFWDSWAFNLNEEEQKKNWALIPTDTDILVTHTPPFGIRDLNQFGTHKVEGGHAGDKFLREKINSLNLKIHIFGHIHEGYGSEGIFYNVAQCDEMNNLKNKPMLIEI